MSGKEDGRGDPWKRVVIEGAGRVVDEDLEEAAGRGREVEERLGKVPRPIFERIGDRARLFASAVSDYASGRYREMPWLTVALAVFAILYFLNPADIFPDVIPLAGYLDDTGVFAAAFAMLMRDLDRYEKWKKGREEGL